MRHAALLHKYLIHQFLGTLILCAVICFVSPSLTPGFHALLQEEGRFPPAVSYFLMDPITKLLAGLIAAPAISAYATVISIDDPGPKRGGFLWFTRNAGLMMLSAGASGFVLWPVTVASANTPEVSAFVSPSLEPVLGSSNATGMASTTPSASLTLMLHSSCAVLFFVGIVIIGATHGARARKFAALTVLPGSVYMIWMTCFDATPGAAWAEYVTGSLGIATLCAAASFDKH